MTGTTNTTTIMGSVIQCIRQVCDDDDDDDDTMIESEHQQQQPDQAIMSRGGGGDTTDCSNSTDVSVTTRQQQQQQQLSPLQRFWQSLFVMPTTYQPIEMKKSFEFFDKESSSPTTSPCLRPADSYKSLHGGTPAIRLEEIVLPGSLLQQQMAQAVQLETLGEECVICMEGFTKDNPRMPTMCGCGENNTYFHLPCLYQWMEQSQECPACRTKLRWQEF